MDLTVSRVPVLLILISFCVTGRRSRIFGFARANGLRFSLQVGTVVLQRTDRSHTSTATTVHAFQHFPVLLGHQTVGYAGAKIQLVHDDREQARFQTVMLVRWQWGA
uniref:Putative secreted peptide n=1 Tax=Anopheles braziliensis TaxID=58242 RepID=A0A2M3ZU47_9DIPT